MGHGFRKIQNTLERLKSNAERLEGEHKVPLGELFDPSFMRTHSSFPDWEKFARTSGLFKDNALTPENFAAIPDEAWEEWVRKNTHFKAWREMQETAGREYVQRKLFEGL